MARPQRIQAENDDLDPQAEHRAELSVQTLLAPPTFTPSEIRDDPQLMRQEERRRDGVALRDEMARVGRPWVEIQGTVLDVVVPAI